MSNFHAFVNHRPTQTTAPPRWTRILWPILVICTISFASTWRVPPSGPEVDWIAIDKVAHVAVYGLLATLWARTLAIKYILPRAAFGAALAAFGFGLADEFMQSRNPARTFEYADLAADAAGTVFALACWLGWPRYRRLLETDLCFWRRHSTRPSSALSQP